MCESTHYMGVDGVCRDNSEVGGAVEGATGARDDAVNAKMTAPLAR